MNDVDQLVLEDEVRGSLSETLVLRGSLPDRDVMVLFASEILDHWPREIQAARLNEMRSFIETATRRALAKRQFSELGDLFPGRGNTCLVVLTWTDIAH